MSDAYIHSLSPFAIEFPFDFLKGFGIRWYGLSYLLGFLAAYFIIKKLAARDSLALSKEIVADLVFWVALGTVIGGRLGYCIFYEPSLFLQFSSTIPFWGVLAIHHGGMASHGGMIGIVVSAWLFARKYKLPLLRIWDLLAVAAPIGIFFGRLANFVNGELVGRACSAQLPWAVKFPQDILLWPMQEPARLDSLSPVVNKLGWSSQTWLDLVHANPLSSAVQQILWQIIHTIQAGNVQLAQSLGPLLTARHPSQLYEAMLEGIFLFSALIFLWKRLKAPGMIAASFLILYSVVRIIGEQFRMPDAQIGFQLFDLTRGQWLSLVVFIAGILLLVLSVRRQNQKL